MCSVLTHLLNPASLVAAVTAGGASVRAVFRYPHMWRYLESRRQNDTRRSRTRIASWRMGKPPSACASARHVAKEAGPVLKGPQQ